jgi:hypothetical protein
VERNLSAVGCWEQVTGPALKNISCETAVILRRCLLAASHASRHAASLTPPPSSPPFICTCPLRIARGDS